MEIVDAGSGRKQVHWVVADFLPWGFDGKHAWVITSPQDGMKRVILKSHLEHMTRVTE